MTRFFNSLTPGQLVGVLAIFQIIVLVTLPYAFSSAPPIDVVEGLVWAPHWLIGTYKHPPLPSWIIELSVLITRDVIFGPFLASQISVAITYGLIFLLGRLLMDPVVQPPGQHSSPRVFILPFQQLNLTTMLFNCHFGPEQFLSMPFCARLRRRGRNGSFLDSYAV